MAARKKPTSRAASRALVEAIPREEAFKTLERAAAAKTITPMEHAVLKDAYLRAEALRKDADGLVQIRTLGDSKEARDFRGNEALEAVIPASQLETSAKNQLEQKIAQRRVYLDGDLQVIDNARHLHSDLEKIAAMEKLIPPQQKAQFVKLFLDFYDLKEVSSVDRRGQAIIAYHEDPDADGVRLFLPVPARLAHPQPQQPSQQTVGK